MLVAGVLVLVVAVFAKQVSPTGMIPDCTDVNEQVDSIVGASDYLMWLHGATPPVDDFQQDFTVSVLGLPLAVSLEVLDGSLNSLRTFARSGPAMECLTSNFRTLEAVFKYDVLEADYIALTVKFWRWQMQGSFSYRIRPTVNLAIAQGTADCTLESFSFVSTDDIEYDFNIDETTWKGWLVAKLLRRALESYGSTTPLLSTVLKTAQTTVDSYFRQAWCQSLKPL